MAANLSLV